MFFVKRPRRDSNPRHQAPEACALSWLSYWSKRLFQNIIAKKATVTEKRPDAATCQASFVIRHRSFVICLVIRTDRLAQGRASPTAFRYAVVGVVPDPDFKPFNRSAL